jgi:hypothetical protein
MIETVTTATTVVAARSTELAQHVTAFPARAVDLVRSASALANSKILAGPVPTVNPTEPPGGAKVMTVVGWVGWGVFAASIAGVLIICIKMATNAHKNRSGDGGGEEAGKLFWPLLACIVGSSAGSILGVVA